MKRKAGIILMSLGTVLVLMALSLLFYNNIEDSNAGRQAEELLEVVRQSIEETEVDVSVNYPGSLNPADTEMKVVEVAEYSYVGYISIPALSLELPVMADCDYSLMRIAPCRYSGSNKTNDLVIAAHNYGRHFGKLEYLKAKDEVYFTDMDGNTTKYFVGGVEVLQPGQVDEMVESEWDLTLFTCTYSGSERVTVRCERE